MSNIFYAIGDFFGIIFNGETNASSEEVIIRSTGIKVLGRIKDEYEFTKGLIKEYARDYIFV